MKMIISLDFSLIGIIKIASNDYNSNISRCITDSKDNTVDVDINSIIKKIEK